MNHKSHFPDLLLECCRSQIESILGWGPASDWVTNDFEKLSEQIFLKSGVRLSVVTLKRVWGTIRYDSKPTVTTLNALARFLDFENWHVYKQHYLNSTDVRKQVVYKSLITFWLRPLGTSLIVLIVLIPLGSMLYVSASSKMRVQTDPSQYSFSSRKAVDIGVPNTVIFDYDASFASIGDTVAIQQSWDARLSTTVDRKLLQHTSVYYHPGYFDARLTVNGVTVKQHELLIKSEGWLPMVDTKPVPVYFSKEDAVHKGYMTLSADRIRSLIAAMQPQVPWTSFYNVGDLGDIYSDDFIFEARVRNDFDAGAAICRNTEVHILFEGGAMVIPLSIPGCVGELNLGAISGKTRDLSAFGTDLSQWTSVKFTISGPLAIIQINDKKAYDFKPSLTKAKWVGMIFKFQGTGTVDFIRVSREKDGLVYEENFDKPAAQTKQFH